MTTRAPTKRVSNTPVTSPTASPTTTKLMAPCPFCGGDDLYITHRSLDFYVVCDGCDGSGPKRPLFADAIGDWNSESRKTELEKISEEAQLA